MSQSAEHLLFPDTESVSDLGTWVARARGLDENAAVRLQAHQSALVVTVPVLEGPVTLGLRIMQLAQPSDVDWVVPAGAIADRVARMQGAGGADALTLLQPPTSVQAAWAGISAPRSGWSVLGEMDVSDIRQVATAGIREVAEGTPLGAGSAAVAKLRSSVWSRYMAQDVPAALAFAAYSLGLLPQDGAQPLPVASRGRWVRLSSPAGHALTRIPAAL